MSRAVGSSRAKELEIDLACISWARRQKEREVRKALIASKSLQQRDTLEMILMANRQEEHKNRKNAILNEEFCQKMVFRDDDLFRLKTAEEKDKREHHKRLERTLETIDRVNQHIRNAPPPKSSQEREIRAVGNEKLRKLERGVYDEISVCSDLHYDAMERDPWRSPLKLM